MADGEFKNAQRFLSKKMHEEGVATPARGECLLFDSQVSELGQRYAFYAL